MNYLKSNIKCLLPLPLGVPVIILLYFIGLILIGSNVYMSVALYITYGLYCIFIAFCILSHKFRTPCGKYFITQKFPFSQFYSIFQHHSNTNTQGKTCNEIRADIMRSTLQYKYIMPPGKYRTVTHVDIIKHIKEVATIDESKTLHIGERSMALTVFCLNAPRCFKKCFFSCPYIHNKKDFYYIEFYVEPKLVI